MCVCARAHTHTHTHSLSLSHTHTQTQTHVCAWQEPGAGIPAPARARATRAYTYFRMPRVRLNECLRLTLVIFCSLAYTQRSFFKAMCKRGGRLSGSQSQASSSWTLAVILSVCAHAFRMYSMCVNVHACPCMYPSQRPPGRALKQRPSARTPAHVLHRHRRKKDRHYRFIPDQAEDTNRPRT